MPSCTVVALPTRFVVRRLPALFFSNRARLLSSVLDNAKYHRDMVGYSRFPPDPRWSKQAKVAVQFVINYEEGGENCILHGDTASEAFLSDISGAEPLIGKRNMNMESIYEYGSRAGFWRLHRLFTAAGFPVTVYAVAMALQRNPAAVAAMQQAQWEIASHGLRWTDYANFTRAEEAAHLREAIRLHAEVTGERPLGWYLGRCSEHTRELVIEEGGFLYDSDSYADDLPFWVPASPSSSPPQQQQQQQQLLNSRKYHLVIPYTLDANDYKFFSSQGAFSNGLDFYQYLRETFDCLYEEASSNSNSNGTVPKMMSVGLHCRISGRPGRASGVKRFLQYLNRFSEADVWVCRRIDIAKHWHQHHYPSPPP